MISKVSSVLFMIQILKRFRETLWLACKSVNAQWGSGGVFLMHTQASKRRTQRNERQWHFAFLRRETLGEDRISAEKDARTWDENLLCIVKILPSIGFRSYALEFRNSPIVYSCVCVSPSPSDPTGPWRFHLQVKFPTPFLRSVEWQGEKRRHHQLFPTLHPEHLFRHPDAVCPGGRCHCRLAAERGKKQPAHRPLASTHLRVVSCTSKATSSSTNFMRSSISVKPNNLGLSGKPGYFRKIILKVKNHRALRTHNGCVCVV